MASAILPAFLVGNDNEVDEAGEAAKKGAGLAIGAGIAGLAVAAGTIGANRVLSGLGQSETSELY